MLGTRYIYCERQLLIADYQILFTNSVLVVAYCSLLNNFVYKLSVGLVYRRIPSPSPFYDTRVVSPTYEGSCMVQRPKRY